MAGRAGWILLSLLILSLLLRSNGVISASWLMDVSVIAFCILINVKPVFFKGFPAKLMLSVFLFLCFSLLHYWIRLSLISYFISGLWILFMTITYRRLINRRLGILLYSTISFILLTSIVFNPRSFHNFYRSTTYEEFIMSKYPEQQGIVADLFINKYKNPDIPLAEEYYKKAINAEDQKEDLIALEFYNKSIDNNPDNSEAYHRRGFLKLTRLELGPDVAYSAVKDFSRAIRLNPSFANAYYHRSVALSYLGNYGRSLLDNRKVLDLDGSMTEEAFFLKYGRSKKSFSVPPHS